MIVETPLSPSLEYSSQSYLAMCILLKVTSDYWNATMQAILKQIGTWHSARMKDHALWWKANKLSIFLVWILYTREKK